ncbi:MAG: ABC transporter ATP-binding protein [Magnetospiraceae bacterium]
MIETPTPPVFSLTVRNARLVYHGKALFDGLHLDLPAGQWTCLLGPSGVGKSSLLRLIAGLEPTVTGNITTSDGAGLPGRLAYMAQADLLLPWLSTLENVALGARLRGDAPDLKRAMALLSAVGLEDAATQRPDALSGGMRQRAALARTLMEDRPLILMDEPFSAVDAITRMRLQDLAARLLAGRTVLFVTHDPLEALRLGDSIFVMRGRPAQLGEALHPPGSPPRNPADPQMLRLQAQLLDQLMAAGS